MNSYVPGRKQEVTLMASTSLILSNTITPKWHTSWLCLSLSLFLKDQNVWQRAQKQLNANANCPHENVLLDKMLWETCIIFFACHWWSLSEINSGCTSISMLQFIYRRYEKHLTTVSHFTGRKESDIRIDIWLQWFKNKLIKHSLVNHWEVHAALLELSVFL